MLLRRLDGEQISALRAVLFDNWCFPRASSSTNFNGQGAARLIAISISIEDDN